MQVGQNTNSRGSEPPMPAQPANVQSPSATAADGVDGGFDSIEGLKVTETATKAVDVAQQAVNQQSAKTPATQVAAAMTLAGQGKMGSNEWAQGLSQRVMVLTSQNNQFAEIQLDPPELGALRVKVQITQEGVNVNFSSTHAAVRDAVEQSIPRLREMMEEQGLSLGESSVSDEQEDNAYAASDDAQGGVGGADGELEGEEQSLENLVVDGQMTGLVDYYA